MNSTGIAIEFSKAQIQEVRNIQKKVRRDIRFKRLRPQPGQFVYETDLKTFVIRQVEDKDYKSINANYGGYKQIIFQNDQIIGGTHRVLNMKEGCHYCCAINKKNVIKQVLRDFREADKKLVDERAKIVSV